MRIVHGARTLDRIGGAEAHLLDLASAQAARGDEVTIVHGGNGMTPAGVTGVRAGADDELPALIAGCSPDVVHLHGEPFSLAAETAVQSGNRVVRSLHDLSFGCATGEHWFRNGRLCERAHGAGCVEGILVRGCAHRIDLRPSLRRLREVGRRLPLQRGAHGTVVYSEYARSVAIQNGIEADRCRAIPYFVDRAPAPPPPPTGGTVAFVGRIVGRKGLDVLIEALAAAAGWDELVVVGDGWDRSRCERLGASLAGRVRFAGWLDKAGVADTLSRARLVAVPSRWPEPFGIVGIEAMAAGRPVVASGVGGIPEWLDDGETGFAVAPGDVAALTAGLERLLADDALAARLGRTAWERSARFAERSHLDALDRVYGRVA